MRANVTIVIDLPEDLQSMLDAIERVTAHLIEPSVFRADFTEYDQRDGHPAQISFTIGGQLEDE